MTEVRIEEPAKMSIAGLILKKIIDQNISNPAVYAKVKELDCIINIQVGRMKLHLMLKNGDIEIRSGLHPQPTAGVAGSMDAILEVGQRQFYKVPGSFLSGKFKVSGNVLALMPLLNILKM